jgi:hypothetical protein
MVNIKKMALLTAIICAMGQSTVQANWSHVIHYLITKPVQLAFGSRVRTGITSATGALIFRDYFWNDERREKLNNLRTQASNATKTTAANCLYWTSKKVQNLSEKISPNKK